jgi:hypothetical protein
MFNIIKSTISAGGYKLTDIMHKIKKMYILGDLTEAQMDELLAMASGGVSTDAERPETLAMIRTLSEEIKALEARVKALEGYEPAEPDEPDVPVYSEWNPWDGISNDYQYGAIVSHNCELWISVCRGQNVWQPGTPGTEALWVKYNPEAVEE